MHFKIFGNLDDFGKLIRGVNTELSYFVKAIISVVGLALLLA